MRKRKLWAVAGLAVAALLAVAGALALLFAPSHAMRDKIARIHEGMILTEVEAILGPPGDYRTEPTGGAPVYIPTITLMSIPEMWQTDEGTLYLYFASGSVIHKWFLPGDALDQSPMQNLVGRAKRQWRRWFP